jgi:hypothetical protein
MPNPSRVCSQKERRIWLARRRCAEETLVSRARSIQSTSADMCHIAWMCDPPALFQSSGRILARAALLHAGATVNTLARLYFDSSM